MDEKEIKTRSAIELKPNPYFSKVDKPFLYQKRGILMMLRRAKMVLGDDVGLGKTMESIVHFSYLKAANPKTKAVVFTEKISLKQWEDEIKAWTNGITSQIVTAETHVNVPFRISTLRQFYRDVLITTYSTAYDYGQYLLEGMGERFVLYADEPSYFKNTGSKLHGKMTEIAEKAVRSYGLTATIIENRLEEAFSIFQIVCPGLIPGKIYFEDNFCVRKLFRKPRYHWRTMGYKNLKVFRDMIEPGFYGRLQTDPEVQQDLPEVIHTDIPVVLGKEQSKLLVEAMDSILRMPDGHVEHLHVLAALIRAQQIADDPGLLGYDVPSAKTEALLEALKGSMNGQKVLIHSKMRTAIDRLEKAVEKQGMKSLRITGVESTDQRVANALQLRDSNEHNVLLMTRAGLKAADALKAANHLIWYDLPWSWGLYRQGVGRIKRTGSQHTKVVSHRMLAVLHPEVAKDLGSDQTIDGYALEVLKKKATLANAITGEEDTLEATTSDIMEVYKLMKESYRRKVA